MKRYGNHHSRPAIKAGDLCTFHGVRSRVKAKVVNVDPPPQHHLDDTSRTVTIQVTSLKDPLYPRGHVMDVSTLWLDRRY